LGFAKSKRRYTCHVCWDSELGRSGFSHEDFQTAHLEDTSTLRCMVCEDKYKVSRKKCVVPDCKGNVIAAEGEFENCCHLCGHEQSEEPYSLSEDGSVHSLDAHALFGESARFNNASMDDGMAGGSATDDNDIPFDHDTFEGGGNSQ
jgi:hypothetical protein